MKRWFRSDQTLVGEGLRFMKPNVVRGVVGPVRRTSFQLVPCVSHGVPKHLDELQRLEREWSEDEQLEGKIGRLRFIKPKVVRGCPRLRRAPTTLEVRRHGTYQMPLMGWELAHY